MLKITTNWKRSEKDQQRTTQHFIDRYQYKTYESTMATRGFQGELIEVIDLDTNKIATIKGNTFQFGETNV